MWQTLNANAGAIQALASLVTVLATVALVLVTWRYVRLTAALATAARQQVTVAEGAVLARQRELLALVKRLRTALGSLPAEIGDAEKIRHSTLWDSQDLANLERLSAELDRESGEHAALASNSMNWLADRVAEVRATPRLQGVNWGSFPWPQWERELSSARSHVEQVRHAVLRTMGVEAQGAV